MPDKASGDLLDLAWVFSKVKCSLKVSPVWIQEHKPSLTEKAILVTGENHDKYTRSYPSLNSSSLFNLFDFLRDLDRTS